jgi:hypothetical protein
MTKFLVFFMLTMIIPLGATHVRAQEACNAADLVAVMTADLSDYGSRATATDTADVETLTTLYVDLLVLRHSYEDRIICDDLRIVNDLMLQIIGEMEDLTVMRLSMLAHPEAVDTYQFILEREVLQRNSATYDLFLEEATRVVNETVVTAAAAAPAPDAGATFNTATGDIALQDWYTYRDGRFRVVAIIDPYVSQNWAQPRAGNRAIGIQLEIACDNPADGECNANNLFISDISLSNGRELARGETLSLVSDSSVPRFYAPQRGGLGETLTGWVYLEIPAGVGFTKMTVFDWTSLRSVGFLLQ